MTAAFSTGEFGTNDWYIDSDSSSHMSTNEHWLEDVEPINKEILIANKHRLKCTKSRSVYITLKSETGYITKDVWNAPELPKNLLSIEKMTEKGVIIVFDSKCR